MYKITYTNGYVRYSKHPYGRKNVKGKPRDVLESMEVDIEDDNDDDFNGHWLFGGYN